MKTTTARSIANPRRTTLAHLEDATGLEPGLLPEPTAELPAVTANPRRTVLMKAPAPAAG
ncbi:MULTISPECIES: hypothetical protein [Streptomyces]|uniref:Uncharacterized protein n=1 Tax=Streptomyces sudanensis TaxID=436397 RepID=A0ABY4TFM5_9ACTN|nr:MULTISPECIES: hypothetical protein [Streptomyces]MCP9957144.1 hypothetical protein [Streptomyces sudanensis]MCP9986314.1 hypothetical protein [Streptomyces sudanensis]MCQ0002283.1 hypothetical protein [Streptomyces sudanensis]URN17724.1 hypothetical protein MW084_19275 [Streptomyces sudanensis]